MKNIQVTKFMIIKCRQKLTPEMQEKTYEVQSYKSANSINTWS